MKYKIRWTKNVYGNEIFDEGFEMWEDINKAFRDLAYYLRTSPKADGYIEEYKR